MRFHVKHVTWILIIKMTKRYTNRLTLKNLRGGGGNGGFTLYLNNTEFTLLEGRAAVHGPRPELRRGGRAPGVHTHQDEGQQPKVDYARCYCDINKDKTLFCEFESFPLTCIYTI